MAKVYRCNHQDEAALELVEVAWLGGSVGTHGTLLNSFRIHIIEYRHKYLSTKVLKA